MPTGGDGLTNNDRIELRVYGIPRPGGSKRAFAHAKTGRIIVTDDCRKNRDWRNAVVAAAVEAYQGEPLLGPLSLYVEFLLPRPRGHFGNGRNEGQVRRSAPTHPVTKPDATKLLRSTEDALTGLLWRDDAQIVRQTVRKLYGSPAGARIVVERMES